MNESAYLNILTYKSLPKTSVINMIDEMSNIYWNILQVWQKKNMVRKLWQT